MCLLYDCINSSSPREEVPGLREDIFTYLDGLGLIELVRSKTGNRVSLYSNPLLAACALHKDQVILFLLERGFDANTQCFYTEYTPTLAFVAELSKHRHRGPEELSASDGIYALVRAGADLTVMSSQGHSVLTLAAYYASGPQIEQIMQLAPSLVDQTNRYGQTPLMAAVIREVNFLRSNGENRNPRDFSRLKPLASSTSNLDAQDLDGNTALHYAAEHDNDWCDRTAHIEDEAEQGWEPLSCILLFSGAQPDVRNNAGQKFLDLIGAPLRAKLIATASRALEKIVGFGFLGLASVDVSPYSQTILDAASSTEAKDLLLRTFRTRVDQAVEAVREGCREDGTRQNLIGFSNGFVRGGNQP